MPPTYACKTCAGRGIVTVLPLKELEKHALAKHYDNLWKLVREVLDLPENARLA